jgi:hypothetical protein
VPTRAALARAALAALVLLACERAPPAAEPTSETPLATPTSESTGSSTAAHPEPFDSASLTRGYAQDLQAGPAGPESRETPTPTAPPPPLDPLPVEVLEAQALIPGAGTALKTGEQTTVDPGSTFRIVLKGTFAEARLSLLDGADAMQPAAGAREAGPTTTVTLQPAAPLRPGGAYRLRVDGATTRELRAADGSVRAPVELHLLAAGEPPPEPRARPKKPKRRP